MVDPPEGGGTGPMKRTAALPMWGCVALAGAAGIVALMWYQRGKSGAAAAAPTLAVDTSAGPNDQNAALLAQIRDLQGSQSTSTAAPSTNDEWLTKALAWFARQPKFAGTTPVLAQIALQDYLAGKKIRGTWEEWTVNTVITGVNQNGQKFENGIGSPPSPPTTPF